MSPGGQILMSLDKASACRIRSTCSAPNVGGVATTRHFGQLSSRVYTLRRYGKRLRGIN